MLVALQAVHVLPSIGTLEPVEAVFVQLQRAADLVCCRGCVSECCSQASVGAGGLVLELLQSQDSC